MYRAFSSRGGYDAWRAVGGDMEQQRERAPAFVRGMRKTLLAKSI
jgi:hypothetical protein